MNKFEFILNSLILDDQIETSEKWRGQIDFPRLVAEGSFLPERYQFFFLDPGTKAKYSYIARVPKEASFVILHCWFSYMDERNYSHTSEKTVAVPKSNETSTS